MPPRARRVAALPQLAAFHSCDARYRGPRFFITLWEDSTMRLFARSTAALAFVCAASFAFAQEAAYNLTGDNTKIEFVGAKPQGKHVGGFKKLTGKATANAADLTSLKISVDIDMTSTYTDDNKLTGHLMSPDFFGVKNNPTSKFVSTKVEKKGDDYVLSGNLTLNGKTAPVTFPAKISIAGGELNVAGTFKIDRNDWGISYGKGIIEKDVSLTVKVAAK
jgi:polyisoprenoid-binding protein YceI